MWAFGVLVGAPFLNDHLGLPEAVEDFTRDPWFRKPMLYPAELRNPAHRVLYTI